MEIVDILLRKLANLIIIRKQEAIWVYQLHHIMKHFFHNICTGEIVIK